MHSKQTLVTPPCAAPANLPSWAVDAGSRFTTIKQAAQARPIYSEAALRDIRFKAYDRTNSRGDIIKGNGSGEAGVWIEVGGKVLLDLDAFDRWIGSHRAGVFGKSADQAVGDILVELLDEEGNPVNRAMANSLDDPEFRSLVYEAMAYGNRCIMLLSTANGSPILGYIFDGVDVLVVPVMGMARCVMSARPSAITKATREKLLEYLVAKGCAGLPHRSVEK